MELKISDEKENPFLKRKELKISIRHENSATPSKESITKELSEKYSVDASQVVVNFIVTKKGITESMASVKILKEKPQVKEVKKTGETKSETQADTSKQASQG